MREIAFALTLGLWTPAACAESLKTSFAFDLFRQFVSSQPNQNILLSPASARWALGMAYAGSKGETQIAMQRTLAVSTPKNNLAADHHEIAALMSTDPKVELSIANSVWIKRRFPIRQSYMDDIKTAYRVEPFVRDFKQQDVAELNAWISAHTGGRIREIISSFSPDESLDLINAVYFKGLWEYPFPAAQTTDETFHFSAGTTEKRRLMSRQGHFLYAESPGYQVVRVPYGAGRIAMIVVLPSPGHNLQSLNTLVASAAQWRRMISAMCEREGRVRLPKFRLEFKTLLNDSLIALGMRAAFDPVVADFGGIVAASILDDKLYISSVLQKTFIEVDETGTEAAAATIAAMVTGSAVTNEPPFEFTADRPFLFAIQDISTEEMLFLGVINDPR